MNIDAGGGRWRRPKDRLSYGTLVVVVEDEGAEGGTSPVPAPDDEGFVRANIF